MIATCGLAFGAQDPSRPPASPPEVRAIRTSEPPTLDGDVINDKAWLDAQPATSFWQTVPVEGAPATEATEVRILFDDRNLYVGVVCFDSDPSGVFASDSRRDASLEETDSFQFILDTFLDRQSGVVFGTNPAAIEYDGQVTREG